MNVSALFIEVRSGRLVDGHLPTLPYLLRVEAEDPCPGRLLVDPIYRKAPRSGYQSLASSRWECEINDGDGRLGKVVYRDDRPEPTWPYGEFLGTLVSLSLFAEGLPPEDRRRIGLLICAKTLLRFWRDDERRLRDALRPPFDSTLV